MTDTPDARLLEQFARNGSEDAFTALVERHIGLVHSVAARHTAYPQQAEDITQAVFILLARKAAVLDPTTVLPGWLYHTARLTAANWQRAETRRVRREQEVFMQSQIEESPADNLWHELSPQLDHAMAGLRTVERDALVLRYFQNKRLAEVGQSLGLSENAAQKRVHHALEKLHRFFLKRGIHSTTETIAATVSACSIQAVHPALAKSVAAVAMAKGATASTSTLTLIKGALKIMAWTKAKTAVVTGAVILLAAGTTTVVVDKIVAEPPRIGSLSATDLSWADNPKYWATDSRVLEKLPAGVFIIRPTRFPNGGGIWANHRMCVKNQSVGDLADNAYSFSYTRTVLPADIPSDRFDVMATVPNWNELLKGELKKRFGLTAHTETRDVDVLLLKVQNPNPPNLKRRPGNNWMSSSWTGGNGKITIQNQDLSGFFSDIESRLGVPVINETGLKGHYDLKLEWPQRWLGEFNKDAYKQALSEQLGLELVPGRQPIKMLIVDQNNSL